MKLLKFWYYGTLFLVFNFLFRVALNWSSNYESVLDMAETSNYYYEKMEAQKVA